MEATVGGIAYRLLTAPRESGWIAWAVRADDGMRFGVECAAVSETEAVERLKQWLAWQHEHAAALAALQAAEHDYHRTIAGSAFAAAGDAPSPIEMQKESLDAVEAARLRLDRIRARRPE